MEAVRVFVIMLIVLVSGDFVRMFHFAPPMKKLYPPACSSMSSVCHLSYRYVDDNGQPMEVMDSEDMCVCLHRGTGCATDWNNRNNSIVKKLHTQDNRDLEVKVSYCHLVATNKRCNFHQTVLETRGRGPIIMNLVHDQLCTCNRRYYLHTSWTEGDYDYFEYSCGKPRCNRLDTDVCMTLTLNATDYTIKHDYHCRCRRNELCHGNIPSSSEPITEHKCIPVENKKDNLVF